MRALCIAAKYSRLCPVQGHERPLREAGYVAFTVVTFSPRWRNIAELARCIGLPLSSYLADILGFDQGRPKAYVLGAG